MNSFEKLNYISGEYATREYTVKDLANVLGMTQTDVTKSLHLNNYYYGIKRTPINMPTNKLCKAVTFESQLAFLEKYNFDFNC